MTAQTPAQSAPVVASPDTEITVTLDGAAERIMTRSGMPNLRISARSPQPGEAGDRLWLEVLNDGTGPASTVDIRLDGAPICAVASQCDGDVTRAWVGNCEQEQCQPCEVVPDPGTGGGAAVRCRTSLAPGWKIHVPVEYAWPAAAPAPTCGGHRTLRATVDGADPNADPSKQAVWQIPANPNVRQLRFFPAEGPLDYRRQIHTILVGQKFRVVANVDDVMCPSTAIDISLAGDRDTGPLLVHAGPAPDHDRHAVTEPIAVLAESAAQSVFWNTAGPHVPSPGDGLVPPTAGQTIRATAGEASADLVIGAQPAVLSSVAIVTHFSKRETEPVREVGEGNPISVVMRIEPDSVLGSEPSLPAILITTSRGRRLAVLTLRRVGPGLYQSSWMYTPPAGATVEVQSPYATPSTHRVFITKRRARIELRAATPADGGHAGLYGGSAIPYLHFDDGRPTATEVIASAIRDQREIERVVLAFDRIVGTNAEMTNSRPLVLAEGGLFKDLRPGDTVRFSAPSLQTAHEIEMFVREPPRD